MGEPLIGDVDLASAVVPAVGPDAAALVPAVIKMPQMMRRPVTVKCPGKMLQLHFKTKVATRETQLRKDEKEDLVARRTQAKVAAAVRADENEDGDETEYS